MATAVVAWSAPPIQSSTMLILCLCSKVGWASLRVFNRISWLSSSPSYHSVHVLCYLVDNKYCLVPLLHSCTYYCSSASAMTVFQTDVSHYKAFFVNRLGKGPNNCRTLIIVESYIALSELNFIFTGISACPEMWIRTRAFSLPNS